MDIAFIGPRRLVHRMNKTNNTLGFVILLVISAAFFCFAGKMAVDVFHQYESASFPTTLGRVSYGEVTVTHGSKGGTFYHVHIYYGYTVNGRSFEGSTFRYASFSPGYDQAHAAVDAHPPGSEITVHYRANDPSDSLLSPGVIGHDFLNFFMYVPLGALLLYQSFMLGPAAWSGRKGLPAGGVKIVSQGSQVRARLPRYPAAGWTVVAFCGTAFGSFLVLALATRRDSSTQPEAIAGVAILVATAGVFLWRRMRLASGADDLVVNEDMQTVTLPQTFGRKHPTRLDFGAIQAVYVNPIRHRNKGGYYYTWAVTLVTSNNAESPEKLTDWRSEDRACGFAAWLRERLHLPESVDQPVA